MELLVCLPNYLWSRPVTPLASIRAGLTDVLGPDVLVGADLSTNRTPRRKRHWPPAAALDASARG
jgi:hypothetical protein